MNIKAIFSSLVLLLLVSCNSSNNKDLASDFSGVWDVRYNFSVQECQITLDGVPGFVDQHIIEQDSEKLSFSSVSGLISPENSITQVSEDQSLVVEELLTGDIYGIGVYCEHMTMISYAAPSDEKSESLFMRTVWCEDDWSCETRGAGVAERQPEL